MNHTEPKTEIAKHTPGPWSFELKEDSRTDLPAFIVRGPEPTKFRATFPKSSEEGKNAKLAYVFSVTAPVGPKGGQHVTFATLKEAEANACLIAAAPELLEALRAIEAHWSAGNFSRDEKLWDSARAAIAKATGK